MNFTEKLLQISRAQNSLLCIGLDVDLQKVPEFLLKMKDPIFSFNKAIIDATGDLVCAYKLNVAFYQAHGEAGWRNMRKTVAYIPEGIVKIADAKVGDISHSSQMYAKAIFYELGFDAVTVNPYLGNDSVQPFIEDEGKGAFFLCLTSNPGCRDFQYFSNGERSLFEEVASKVRSWNQKGNCGLVVGATHSHGLQKVRQIAPELPILIPGVGAQKGNLEMAVRYGCNEKGQRIVINSSRQIIYSSSEEDFAEAAREQALKLRDVINRIREAVTSQK